MSSSTIQPGRPWLDTLAKPIQAHGGGIIHHNGHYYWYGEDKRLGNYNRTGISAYRSADLLNWEHLGVVLPKDAMPPEFRDDGVCERPKTLFCPKSGKFVMWMHLDDREYKRAEAGIATAEVPEGPFVFQNSHRPIAYDFGYPENDRCNQRQRGNTFRDMNLFQDDDGSAYVFYASEDNATLYIARLADDYTKIEPAGPPGTNWSRNFPGQYREAPAPFKHNGRYYLLTSGCTGWSPNPMDYATAPHPLGPWTSHGNPCHGPESETSFRSQPTCVIPHPGKPNRYIYMGDRWEKEKLETSTYIWLPFEIDREGKMGIGYVNEWELGMSGQRAEKEIDN